MLVPKAKKEEKSPQICKCCSSSPLPLRKHAEPDHEPAATRGSQWKRVLCFCFPLRGKSWWYV